MCVCVVCVCMCVCVYVCVCYVCVSNCVWSRNLSNETAYAPVGLLRHKQNIFITVSDRLTALSDEQKFLP